jgi:hypothetical protein
MICSSAIVTTAARSQLPDFKNCGRGVASVGKVRYRRVTAPLLCLEGRADGLRTSIAAVSTHGAAASYLGARLRGLRRNDGNAVLALFAAARSSQDGVV